MNSEQFDEAVKAAMSLKPAWFADVEKPATRAQIDKAEQDLGINIPEEYKHFARRFGAGYFGPINISSLVPSSEWYRLDKTVSVSEDKNILIVSDDGTGGYYGFLVDKDHCGSEIFYFDPDDNSPPERISSSFFDYIMDVGLNF